jgi:hypothetical protein
LQSVLAWVHADLRLTRLAAICGAACLALMLWGVFEIGFQRGVRRVVLANGPDNTTAGRGEAASNGGSPPSTPGPMANRSANRTIPGGPQVASSEPGSPAARAGGNLTGYALAKFDSRKTDAGAPQIKRLVAHLHQHFKGREEVSLTQDHVRNELIVLVVLDPAQATDPGYRGSVLQALRVLPLLDSGAAKLDFARAPLELLEATLR